MKKWIIALAVLTAATATTQADVVTDRTAAMDQIRAGAATLVPMMKGKTEFNEAVAALALRMTYAGSIAFDGKFPDGSESKGANPAIWANETDFEAKVANFKKDARHAVDNLPTSLDQLKTVYTPLLQDCAACHELYRIKSN